MTRQTRVVDTGKLHQLVDDLGNAPSNEEFIQVVDIMMCELDELLPCTDVVTEKYHSTNGSPYNLTTDLLQIQINGLLEYLRILLSPKFVEVHKKLPESGVNDVINKLNSLLNVNNN